MAASLLELLSFVYPKDICAELYNPSQKARGISGTGTGHLMRIVSNVEAQFSSDRNSWIPTNDIFAIREAFASLLRLCLLSRMLDHNSYVIHPVVHVWARERL